VDSKITKAGLKTILGNTPLLKLELVGGLKFVKAVDLLREQNDLLLLV
jgi:hypothetical protein